MFKSLCASGMNMKKDVDDVLVCVLTSADWARVGWLSACEEEKLLIAMCTFVLFLN